MLRLRVVEGTDAGRQPDESLADKPSLPARPADRLEPWPAGDDVRHTLRRAARERRISFDLAAVLVAERALLEDELARRALASLIPALDAAAARAKIQGALAEPQRSYLRALCTPLNAHLAREYADSALVALPMRLTDRIESVTVDELLRADLLDSALRWERAAVGCGQTMSEWAAFAALDLLASRH